MNKWIFLIVLSSLYFICFSEISFSQPSQVVVIDSSKAIGVNNLSLGFQLDYPEEWRAFRDRPALRQLAEDANFKLVIVDDRHLGPLNYSKGVGPCTYWNETTKTGSFNWTDVDAVVQAIFDTGAEPLICISAWRNSDNRPTVPPGMAVNPDTLLPYPDSYAAFVAAWVQHFKGKGWPVRHYQIFNEIQTYIGWNWYERNETRVANFVDLFNAAYTSMHQVDSNVKVSFDASTLKFVFPRLLSNAVGIDSFNFHKYDDWKYSPNAFSDQEMFQRAESIYFQGNDIDTFTVDYVRDTWLNQRGVTLPVILSEGNWNAAANPTDDRIQKMAGAVRTAMIIRMGMLKGLCYNVYYILSSDAFWENQTWGSGRGYGMIDSNSRHSASPSYNNPWYPYYVHKMIGNNLAVGDSIINSTPTSNDIRSIAWLNNEKINILLIHNSTQIATISLQGVEGQFNYSKIDDPTNTTYSNPIVQTGTIYVGNPITMNGYTVMLLQSIPHYISGKLIDKYNNPINATISIDSISNSTVDGNYFLKVPSNIYDVQYKIFNFFIPDFWIKLLSLNITSDIQDLVNYITGYPSENNVSFTVNVTGNQTVQTYSPNKPKRVIINGTETIEVSSLSALTNNTWFYGSTDMKLYIKVSEQSIPSPMLHTSGTEFFDGYGNEVFLKGVNVDKNTKMKKNGTTSDATSPEQSWFTENDVKQIRDYGGNEFEIHGLRLGQIMPVRGVVDENYFVIWLDKWVAWGEKYKVYYLINIDSPANYSWGTTYPRWLWEGLYPEPTNDAECDAIVRDFFDTNVSKQDVNRQAFIDAWKFIASRYKNNSYAIFSIMNEPLYHIDKPNSTTARHLGDTYSILMTQVVDGIRSTGAQQIILIDKPDVWYLSNVKPVDRNNVAWEDHLYVSSSFNISQWKSAMDTYVQKYTVEFGKPFFVGEYGVDPPLAVADWQNAISQEVAYLNTKPIAGRQWHQWGYLEGEYYDFVYNYFTPTESDWIIQNTLG